jgi:hypothetical protein
MAEACAIYPSTPLRPAAAAQPVPAFAYTPLPICDGEAISPVPTDTAR